MKHVSSDYQIADIIRNKKLLQKMLDIVIKNAFDHLSSDIKTLFYNVRCNKFQCCQNRYIYFNSWKNNIQTYNCIVKKNTNKKGHIKKLNCI